VSEALHDFAANRVREPSQETGRIGAALPSAGIPGRLASLGSDQALSRSALTTG
jgi:hypothetical protein